MSRSVTDVVAGWLDTKLSRRSLLSRGAIAATALATNPISYALRPGTAYESLYSPLDQACPRGSRCLSGFSEFCCTLNGGYNWCPEGSVFGGWWKADYSSYCNGARYYLDCNATCSCHTGCGGGFQFCDTSCDGQRCECGQNNCNNWVTGCFQFRYGQCNQHVTCLGRIICRVVSCEAPWDVDASCTRTFAVDNGTAEMNVSCNTKTPPAAPHQPTPEEIAMVVVTCTDHPANQVEWWVVTSDGYKIPVETPAASPARFGIRLQARHRQLLGLPVRAADPHLSRQVGRLPPGRRRRAVPSSSSTAAGVLGVAQPWPGDSDFASPAGDASGVEVLQQRQRIAPARPDGGAELRQLDPMRRCVEEGSSACALRRRPVA